MDKQTNWPMRRWTKTKKEANSKNSFIGVGVQQPSSAFYFFHWKHKWKNLICTRLTGLLYLYWCDEALKDKVEISTWSKIVWHFKIVKIFLFYGKWNNSRTLKSNEHEIPAVTTSYHSTKLGVLVFFEKGAYFVVTKENMLFCLIGY